MGPNSCSEPAIPRPLKIRLRPKKKRAKRSPRTIEELCNHIPPSQTHPTWESVRQVLTRGNLRCVNIKRTTSIDPDNLFGLHATDKPHLVKYSPFGKNKLKGKEAMHLIRTSIIYGRPRDLREYLAPRGTGLYAEEIIVQLLTDRYESPGSGPVHTLWNIEVPDLVSRWTYPTIVTKMTNGTQLLGQNTITANIFPSGAVADLHHDIGFVPSTLIKGEKLWLVWPPTELNLKALYNAYEASLQSGDSEFRIFKSFESLSDGIVFLQSAGTTLWVPPFCPHAVFTTKTSILVGGEIYAKYKFPQRLENVRLHMMWEKVFDRASGREHEISELLLQLEHVLHTGTGEKELRAPMLRAWDRVRGPVLRELLNDDADVEKQFKDMWRKETSNWEECPLCGALEEGERLGGRTRGNTGFRRHFDLVHSG